MHIVRCKFSGHFFSSDPKANPVGAMGGAGIGMHKKLVKVYYIFRIWFLGGAFKLSNKPSLWILKNLKEGDYESWFLLIFYNGSLSRRSSLSPSPKKNIWYKYNFQKQLVKIILLVIYKI